MVKAFALMMLGFVLLLGWLVSRPDPSRAEQEALLKNSAPQLEHSFEKVLEHSEQLGVPQRAPASIPPVGEGAAPNAPSGPVENAKDAEKLAELVQSPVTHEDDITDRFRQAQNIYRDQPTDRAVGTMRELVSMMRILQGGDPRLQLMERELEAVEVERAQKAAEAGKN